MSEHAEILEQLRELSEKVGAIAASIGTLQPNATVASEVAGLHRKVELFAGDARERHQRLEAKLGELKPGETIARTLQGFQNEASAGFNNINDRLDSLHERFDPAGNDALRAAIQVLNERIDGEAEARQTFLRLLEAKLEETRLNVVRLDKRTQGLPQP